MENLQIEIVTSRKKLIEEDFVDWVTLPGSEGELGILKDHIPLLTTLDSGVLTYQTGGKRHAVAVHWGYAQVDNNRVTVLAELAEKAEEIDLARAQSAQQKAQGLLVSVRDSSDAEEQKRLDRYEAKLKRSLTRQTAAKSG